MAARWSRSGWAVAAASTLLWLFSFSNGAISSYSSIPDNATVETEPATDEQLVRYLNERQNRGDIVGMLPRRVMQAVPSADGENLDVVYVRGWLERAEVKELYSPTEDEQGRVVVVPVPKQQFISSGPF